MIYLLAGENTGARNEAFEKIKNKIQKDVEIFSISKNDFNFTQIESLYKSAGLFASKHVVVLSYVLEKEEAREFVLEKLLAINDSPNDFIFLEGKLSKVVLDQFKKVNASISLFDSIKEKKEKFNTFILANNLGDRDRLNLWINFRRAIENDVSPEEISGILFWKVKDMILKRNFSKFSETELKKISSKIALFLPSIRREGKDPEVAFEEFLLNI